MVEINAEQRAANRTALANVLRAARENPTPALTRAKREQEAIYQHTADIAAGRRSALR